MGVEEASMHARVEHQPVLMACLPRGRDDEPIRGSRSRSRWCDTEDSSAGSHGGLTLRARLDGGLVTDIVQRSVGISLMLEISSKSRSVNPPTAWVEISIRTVRYVTIRSG